ncbi:MAG: TetR/AcrR family transcriptional regulator [Rhodospirillales bacterium]
MGRPREFDEAEALVAAMDVFWRRGYTSAGMQELCGAMGLNPGSLYAAFGSKQDLFIAAVRRYLDEVIEEGIGVIAAAPSGLEGIRTYFDYIVQGIETGRRRQGCLGTNSFMEVGARDAAVREMMTDHFGLLESAFRRALDRDGVADAAAQARYLVCVAQGLNVLARTAPDRAALDAIVAAALTPLLARERAA